MDSQVAVSSLDVPYSLDSLLPGLWTPLPRGSSSLDSLLPGSPSLDSLQPGFNMDSSLPGFIVDPLLYGLPSSSLDSSLEDAFTFDQDFEGLVAELLEETDQHSHLFLSTTSRDFAVTSADFTFSIFLDPGLPLPDLNNLDITIVGPTGCGLTVTQKTRLSDRIACVFRPLLPGRHLIRVHHGHRRIQGSPSLLFVSRNYPDAVTSRPIVNMDIEVWTDHTSPREPRMEHRKPWGVACNTNTEQLLIADRDRHEILVFGPDGEPHFTFGRQGSGPGQLWRPTGIAFDAAKDRILVTDKDNHRVQIFSPTGKFIATFGSRGRGPGQFLFPWGIAVSPDGSHVAVVDSRNHRIQLFTAEGLFLRQYRVYTGRGCQLYRTEFDYPRGVAFSPDGQWIYVTDFNLHAVFQLDVGLRTCIAIVNKGSLRRPSGIAVDDVGQLLVCDSKSNCIRVFAPDGSPRYSIATVGPHQVDQPLDITLMKTGFVAFLDLNGRVLVF